MKTSDTTSAINSKTFSWYRLMRSPAGIIILLQIIFVAVTYPLLPAMVPSHWDIQGQIDGYAPKLLNTILFPLMGIGIYFFIYFSIALSIRFPSKKTKYQTQLKFVNLIAISELIIFLVLQVVITSAAFHFTMDNRFIVNMVIAALFIVMGNYMGKLRPNFMIGIRTPWSLKSEVVWERTHRLGGWLYVGAGIVGIMLGFIPWLRPWGVLALCLLVVAYLYLYSYLVFHRIQTQENETVRPPVS